MKKQVKKIVFLFGFLVAMLTISHHASAQSRSFEQLVDIVNGEMNEVEEALSQSVGQSNYDELLMKLYAIYGFKSGIGNGLDETNAVSYAIKTLEETYVMNNAQTTELKTYLETKFK